jgi:hypothetical protein
VDHGGLVEVELGDAASGCRGADLVVVLEKEVGVVSSECGGSGGLVAGVWVGKAWKGG